MTQLELGLAPVQRDHRLAVGDRVLVPETASACPLAMRPRWSIRCGRRS